MTCNHDDLQRSLGRVEGNQSAMSDRMDRFEKLVSDGFQKVEGSIDAMREDVNARLSQLEATEVQRKGAWKIIGIIAGAAGAVASAIFSYLLGKYP